MNRAYRKAKEKAAQKRMEKGHAPFRKILPGEVSAPMPRGATEAFANNHYVAFIYPSMRAYINGSLKTMIKVKRLMVQRHDNKPIPNHWRELQNIKNDILGSNVQAIEFYPPEDDVIDHANIYWLWILPDEAAITLDRRDL